MLHAQPEMKEGLDGGSEPTNELETPGYWPLQGLWGEVANAGEGASRLNGQMEPLGWPRQGPPSMQCTQPQLLFLPILQFFPSVSTISSKTIQNEHWSTVSQYFHCLSPRCYISNESLLPDKKGEQIMLCRLDLYSHNGTEIKPKNHVVPIDPRKPR